MFHFVYLTTNLINGKQYVGDHSCEDYLKSNYIGSGISIRKAKKKYGKENFKREILEFFDDQKTAFENQEKYIKKYNTLTPNGYNISPTGGTRFNGIHSKKSKEKISISQFNMPEERKERMAKTHQGMKHSEKTKNKQSTSHIGENNPMYGKPAWDAINRIRKKCEYCGLETTIGNYKRWHGENCKHRF